MSYPIIVIELTPEQFQEAEEIGEERRKRDLAAGAKEKIYSRKDPKGINVQGAVGEMVVSIWTGWPMDKDTTPRKGGIDFVAPTGVTIDVKHTENTSNPKLSNPAYKIGAEYHADVYILVAGSTHSIYQRHGIMGWAFHGELMSQKTFRKATVSSTVMISTRTSPSSGSSWA